jgi:hypothetical protein
MKQTMRGETRSIRKELYTNVKPLLKIVTKEKSKEGKDEVRSGK